MSVDFDPDATSADPAADAILTGLRSVLPSPATGVLGVGVAVPGLCDSHSGTVIGSSQLPGLHGTALIERLAVEIAAPIVLDNDARAQALGEKWFGEGRGVQSFAAVQTGHGLGLGLVLDGVIVRGPAGYTGELGHTCVVANGGELCRCGLRGCWETVATLGWLRAEAQRLGLHGAATMDAATLCVLAASSEAADTLLNQLRGQPGRRAGQPCDGDRARAHHPPRRCGRRRRAASGADRRQDAGAHDGPVQRAVLPSPSRRSTSARVCSARRAWCSPRPSASPRSNQRL